MPSDAQIGAHTKYCLQDICLGSTLDEVQMLGRLTLFQSTPLNEDWSEQFRCDPKRGALANFVSRSGDQFVLAFRDYPNGSTVRQRYRVASVAINFVAGESDFEELRSKIVKRYDMHEFDDGHFARVGAGVWRAPSIGKHQPKLTSFYALPPKSSMLNLMLLNDDECPRRARVPNL